MSDSLPKGTELPEGATGVVLKINDYGTALIQFDSEQLGKEWVQEINFDKLGGICIGDVLTKVWSPKQQAHDAMKIDLDQLADQQLAAAKAVDVTDADAVEVEALQKMLSSGAHLSKRTAGT